MSAILATVCQGVTMTAQFLGEREAMEAAVNWIEGEAQTRLTGDLRTRWLKARAWWTGQGGTIEIIPNDWATSHQNNRSRY